jgi:hypothetical protein
VAIVQIIFDVDEYDDMEELLACREWLEKETSKPDQPAEVSLDQALRMLIRNWKKTADNYRNSDGSSST